ncbi:MAG: BamA/TamA family outer membrane protein [Cyclobacteriaceae bacterium]|nr:BamA/TamA family outer membrane protein [Cyclobacteriaceae bacterium]
MKKFVFLILTTILLNGFNQTFAQQSRETFGKNRFQYRPFKWEYLSGENFDVYYYDERKGNASETLEYLEGEFDRITDLIGFPPYFKTKVFIYNSLSDLRQSNVGLNRASMQVGGETEFIRPYVEVAYTGTSSSFKEELLFKIAELLVNEMMYGGNLKDAFQNAFLLNLPEWFVQGAIHYAAKGWSPEMDDYARELVMTKKPSRFSRLAGKEAALAGQSFWNYIAERYGKSSIHNVLNYTRVTRNEEKSLQITLGVNYKRLLIDWENYYKQMATQVNESYLNPDKKNLLTKKTDQTISYTAAKISPDGRYLAFSKNDRGSFVVIIKSLETGKEKTILRGGTKVISQEVDNSIPLISWADANNLGVIGQKKGEYWFWLYDLSTNSKLPRPLEKFNNIRSISFSNNGRLAVLSADYEGKNDLFLLSTRRDRTRRLTNDSFDDLDPSFIPGTNKIVFASNRNSDTLQTGKKVPLNALTHYSNLYIYDLDSTKNLLKRVTNTLSHDFAPKAVNQDVFYYLSDQRGIVNLFKYSLSNGIYTQVTNYRTGIISYDLNADGNYLSIVTADKLEESIYIDKNFDANRQIFTPSTKRKELQQARVIREKKIQTQTESGKKKSLKELLNERMKAAQDSVKKEKESINKLIDKDSIEIPKSDTLIKPNNSKPTVAKENNLNTDNYTFEDEVVSQPKPTETFLNRFAKAKAKEKTTGPFPYDPKFSASNLVTSLVIDPLRGLGFQLETQMNDMLENYRLYGGLMTTFDFRSGDVYGEFQWLARYIDFSVRYDRKAIQWETLRSFDNNDPDNFRYSLDRIEFGTMLPLSDRARFAIKPFASIARSVNIGSQNNFGAPPNIRPTHNPYGGIKAEFVYDNSIIGGNNFVEGTRGKISFIHHENFKTSRLSFSQVSIDLRHYQRLYKEIVFAVRGFAGSFFGNAPKQYMLGGMENWIGNATRTDGTDAEGNPNPIGLQQENQNLLFVEFVTNLRGFNYGTLFGNNVMVANAELRVPLFKVLSNSPISSSFFRNFQFTTFYDIGTSWSGAPPFSSEQSVSNDIINQPPFKIEVKNYLNPWLFSYGTGFRSVVLGYYVKLDVAWPVENFERQDPRFFFTLGYDF